LTKKDPSKNETMKKTLLFIFLLLTIGARAQEPFIITWEATTTNADFDLVVYSYSPSYNYTIDFGDGTVLTNQTQSVQHSYAQTGVYNISISGVFPELNLGDFTRENVLSVEQWGDIVWNATASMFSFCPNLVINATDAPDLSQVTDASFMFNGCVNFNQNINHWNVSNITNMVGMFRGCTTFNQPLNNWNTLHVNNMAEMFANATNFNQSLDSWNVSNVLDMSYMFSGSSTYNQPLNNWITSNLSTINHMFFEATSFNQPIDNWNTSNLTELISVFEGATSFNQSIASWDVSNVTNMTELFFEASSFDQSIDNWDVSSVTNMSSMFAYASSYNKPLNSWDISNVTTLWSMFFGASSFNQPLDNWNTSNVDYMFEMFENATSFDQDLSSWDFTNVSASFGWGDMLSYSNLSIYHYDKLLLKLASSDVSNVSIGVHGLEYCNFNAHNYLQYGKGWSFSGDGGSANCNTIVGTVYYDINNDGCTNSDIEATNLLVKAEDSNMFDVSSAVINGSYEIPVHTGSQTVFISNLPDYFTATPQSETVDFSTTSTEQVDFCLTANQVVEDLNISILPINQARPGFESRYKLIIKNVGTEIINGVSAEFTFDNTKQSFVLAVPNETSATTNSVNFSLGTIQPFGSIEVDFTMQNFTAPTVNADDILNFTAVVTPDANDFTPNDNVYEFNQIVVNAFDPNDKRVLQGETITFDEADEYLDYIIRFQNTGSANATFVRIEDVLDTELDWSTLAIADASHDHVVSITNGNEVEFFFENINLPYQAADEPNSHGYIAYKIKPKTTAQIGDIMSGDASIYFDYNLPIITNMVSTEIIEPLSIEDFFYDDAITIYPNPVNNHFKIEKTDGLHIESIKLYNFSGMLIKEFSAADEYTVNGLDSGIYILKIKTETSEIIKKLIKS
jgi:surface protein